MWLPGPVYKNAPYFWMSVGVGLIVVGTIGFQHVSATVGLLCLVAGAASCFWSVHIALYRQGHPEPTESAWPPRRARDSEEDPGLDQTCELSYNPDES